jgi:hypothetical protein
MPGTYQDQPGSISCKRCSRGRTFNSSVTGGTSEILCIACDKGQYQQNEGTTFCLPCLTGRFQNQTGRSGCKDCSIGLYNDGTGKQECKMCVTGQYQDELKGSKCKGKVQNIDCEVLPYLIFTN